MKFDQLAYFLEAARHQHLGRAAKVLAISPSAISHTITSLEDQLGHPLFEKQGKRIYLTDHGRRLAERAESLLQEIEQLKDELSAEHVEWTGVYRVAATHGLAARLLAPTWESIARPFPGLRLDLSSMRSADIVTGVASGEVDLGVCYSPLPDPRLHAETIFKDELVLAARADHPLFKLPAAKRLAAAAKFSCAAPKALQGIENCETHPVLAAHGLSANEVGVRLTFDSYEVAVDYILASDAWALLPAWFVRTSEKRLKSICFAEKPTVEVAAIAPKNRWIPRALRGFLAELRKRAT